jgi:hypothetical protein
MEYDGHAYGDINVAAQEVYSPLTGLKLVFWKFQGNHDPTSSRKRNWIYDFLRLT